MNLRTGLSSFFFALVLVISTLCAASPQSAEHRSLSNSVPPSCNVTVPNGSQPPDKTWGGSGSTAWKKAATAYSYGNGRLWTTLPVDGKLHVVPDEQGKLGEKWIWYRTVHGRLSISGRRLDGPGDFRTGPLEEIVVGRDTGLLVNDLVFPSEGCWQITGSAGETGITFVVNVQAER
jgi:hypothetical protein